MDTAPTTPSQERMNAHHHDLMTGLRDHAERNVRLARTAGNVPDTARAQARLDTLTAVLGIYAAAHFHAHGTRPWPPEPRP